MEHALYSNELGDTFFIGSPSLPKMIYNLAPYGLDDTYSSQKIHSLINKCRENIFD
jgi:hypothetical protein